MFNASRLWAKHIDLTDIDVWSRHNLARQALRQAICPSRHCLTGAYKWNITAVVQEQLYRKNILHQDTECPYVLTDFSYIIGS